MSSAVHSALGWAHPVVAEWFLRRFGSPTEPQEAGWPEILAGRTTLIAAPTGSGKTLAAFLACIDRLVRKALAGQLEDRTEVLYISPLKALGNDIQKNLEVPLGEILQLASERGLMMPEIRTAVRTGDTLAHERQKMLKRPPHILVTTPESLYILLTAEKSRRILRDVETVIVDEIHAVAGDKRGAHLLLSLERLEAVTAKPPVRIGLSATQKPIEQVAEFLNGAERPSPVIVDVGHKRELDLAIEVPPMELGPIATNEMWDTIYDRIAELSRQHRSTLVFVNTRRQVERVSLNLAERIGEEFVAAHHGSLARKIRLEAERRLKNGEIKVLVATASLQLGIDIGFVDLVCQIESPRSIAVGLQRIGRAGHWRGAIPKGRLFATTREQLAELASLVRGIKHGDLDRILIPKCPLDVLAQQIVAECAAASKRLPAGGVAAEEELDQSGYDEDELFALLKRAYPYRDLSREEYNSVLEMLSEGIAARRGRYGAYLHRDRVNKRLRARRGARMTAITSGGAIPETALYTVVLMPEGTMIGTVDEDYAVESLAGDVMLLGNSSWRISRIESKTGRILVEDAHGQAPNIPFWRGEAPARTAELSSLVADLRQQVSDMLPNVSPVGSFAEQSCGRGNGRMAEVGMRPRRCRRRTDHPALPERTRRPGSGAHAENGHRRALLRRRRRHATGDPCALRRAHQQGLGIGAAQAFLPQLQLRIAGCRNRRRPEHLTRRTAQLPAGRCVSLSAAGNRARCPATGGAHGIADLRHTLALGCESRARAAAISRAARRFHRTFSACAPTICSHRFSRMLRPARRISKATYKFPTIR